MKVNLNSLLAPHGINCLALSKILKCNKMHASFLMSGERMLSPSDVCVLQTTLNINREQLVTQQNEWLSYRTNLSINSVHSHPFDDLMIE